MLVKNDFRFFCSIEAGNDIHGVFNPLWITDQFDVLPNELSKVVFRFISRTYYSSFLTAVNFSGTENIFWADEQ